MSTDLHGDVGLLKVLAEPARWRIVQLLADEELCVCHLVDELDAAQPVVSHHLRVLREAGLVESERFRYWTYYRLVPDAIAAAGKELFAVADRAAAADAERRPCC